MKNIFEIVVIIFITLSVFVCLILFSEEVLIRQESVQLRSKVSEIVEINSGYTLDAETKINNLISNFKYKTEISVSKKGKLNYGEELKYTIKIYNKRKLPFTSSNEESVSYEINGSYYNINY